jgi:CheY-specific phosphatase CheX
LTQTELHKALTEAVEEALEKMFFVPGLGELDPEAAPEADLCVRVEFEGDPRGRMTLRVTAASAHTIAADFLGEDEADLAEARVHEVVCELTNMICGAVLSRVESAEDFHLATPRVLTEEVGACAPGGVEYGVDIGGGTLRVVMEMENEACCPDEKSAS